MQKPNRNEQAEFLTLQQTMNKLNLCRRTTLDLARKSGALCKIGRNYRVKWNQLNKYFTDNYIEQA